VKIETSTDWQEIHRLLRVEMKSIGYNQDLEKMVRNIDKMVADLSRLEVLVRRTRNTVLHTEKVEQINLTIDHLWHKSTKLMR
jgi:transcriptional regulator of heat shock response